MKILFYFLCFMFDLSSHCVSTFNIDTDYPIIYLDQSKYFKLKRANKTSYFGLSVILHSGDNINLPWIQIGAPRSNSQNLPAYSTPGAVFRCSISSPNKKTDNPCKSLRVETNPLIRRNYIDEVNNAWIGAVMDINEHLNRTVVCAPRWTRHVKDGREDNRMLGACYWSHIESTQFNRMVPLSNQEYHIYRDPETQVSVYNWGQGGVGFSVHLPLDKNEVLIGAPGVFDWTGTNIMYKDVPLPDNPTPSRYTMDSGFSEPNIPDAVHWKETSQYGLLGYAVTSGHFYSKKVLHYVGGAPNSKDYVGQIILYEFRNDTNMTLNVKETRAGTQFGEYYGASLAAGDIDGDGADDLFVGAPFHKTLKYNEGAMYVYFGNQQNKALEEPYRGKVLYGKQPGSQFGTAITYLGNMNKDGYRYVAVSAPYEEVSGVVYIYRGEKSNGGVKTGLKVEPVQRIIGSSFLPEIRGFGISISKPTDIDGNGYGDIAIGAYKSGHAVLLRSKPLITIRTWFETIPGSISNNAEEFDVVLCHEFRSYRSMETIEIERKLVVDEVLGRAYLKNSADAVNIITLYINRRFCEKNISILIKKSQVQANSALSILAKSSLIERKKAPRNVIINNVQTGEDEFCMRCGVQDENKLDLAQDLRKVSFFLECAGHEGCISELEFNCYFNGTGVRNNTFIIGASNVIELITKVKNKGETAYALQIGVQLPKNITLKYIPRLCEENETMILCSADIDPLETNIEASLTLKLDMGLVNQKIESNNLQINVTVITASQNKNNNFKTLDLSLAPEVDIYLSGKSKEQSYSYGNKSSNKINFQQTYQIGKLGLSPVTRISFAISIPYAIKSSSGETTFLSLYPPQGTLEGGQPILFKSELEYLENRKIQSSEGIVDQKLQDNRRKRSVEIHSSRDSLTMKSAKIEEEKVEQLGDKILDINCERDDVVCTIISGSIGPFKGLTKSAVVELRMVFDVKALSGLLSQNAVIRFSTNGTAIIENPSGLTQTGTRPDSTIVSSIFVNDEKKIAIWIIILSVIIGLLLLTLLTLGLIKAGFFKRAKKEELEQMKSKAQMNNSEDSTNENNMDKICD